MGLANKLRTGHHAKAPVVKQSADWTTMSFDIKSGLSLYFGLALLLIALLLSSGILIIWIIPQWEQTDLQTNLIRTVFSGWAVALPTFSGLFFVAMGLSDKKRKILLDQTQLVFDPLFWREKLVVRYEQIGEVVWYYKRRHFHRMDRVGIAIHYHPLNSSQQIDESRYYKLLITGAENKVKLLEELQRRKRGTSPVGRLPVLPNSLERTFLVTIGGSLFYGPIILLVLIKLFFP